MLPPFQTVARRRPVDLVAPTAVLVDATDPGDASWETPHPAPYAAVVAELGDPAAGRVELELTGSDGTRFVGWYDGARAVGLDVTAGGSTSSHRSRRLGTTSAPATGLALTLTGTHLTVLTRGDGAPGDEGWTARGRYDLRDRFGTRDEGWLASLRSGCRWVGGGPSGRSGPSGRRGRRRCGG